MPPSSESAETLIRAKMTEKIDACLKANDLQGALVHTEALAKLIRESADTSVLRKIDAANAKQDVTVLMGLARKFRHAHSEDYDSAYRRLETSIYDTLAKQHWPRDHAMFVSQFSGPDGFKFADGFKRALEEPTIDQAINFICIWECERAIAQARKNDHKSWDTCFEYVMYEVRMAWMKRERQKVHHVG